jgi:hypothetical protein
VEIAKLITAGKIMGKETPRGKNLGKETTRGKKEGIYPRFYHR